MYHLSQGCRAAILLLLIFPVRADEAATNSLHRLYTIAIEQDSVKQSLQGRIVVEAEDGGVLLEERNGRYHQLSPATILSKTVLDSEFSYLTGQDQADDLLAQTGSGFKIIQSEHYLIATNSGELFAAFCGSLLDRVHDKFYEFCSGHEVELQPLPGRLPVIIFANADQFRQYAARQHPDVRFQDTPGYYSIRDNQIMVQDLVRDDSIKSNSAMRRMLAGQPWQVSTIVHEATHQLAFNSGLQVRLADNPVWYSEGLAVYFEPGSTSSHVLWSRPGLINQLHLRNLKSQIRAERLQAPLNELLQTDQLFTIPEMIPAAYAESWALFTYLEKRHPEDLANYMRIIRQRKPLIPVAPEDRLNEFRDVFGKSTDEIEGGMVPYFERMRLP